MKKAILTAGAIVALASAAPASASIRLDAWWPLYEGKGTVAHDASFNGNAGALSGGVRWAGGYIGTGLSLDGTTGQVRVPDSSNLEPSAAVTVTALVKSAGSPGAFKYIIAKGAAGCIAASYGLYTGPNGGVVFYVSHNGGLSYSRSPDGGTGVWDGNWHFVVGTYDGTSVRLYVDGRQIGTGTPDSGSIGYGLSSDNDLYIGHYPGCSGLDFAGAVDEPTVWTGALNAFDVSAAYQLLSALHRYGEPLSYLPRQLGAEVQRLSRARHRRHVRHLAHVRR